jgi:hypothetical protein
MSNERNSHRIAIVLFALAVIIAIVAAFVTTLEQADTGTADNETPPGTTGLAKPHPPLDLSPGQPVLGPPAGDRLSLSDSPRAPCMSPGPAKGRRWKSVTVKV